MSAERRRVALAALVAIGLAIAAPRPALAHAIGGAFQLPVPLWLYLLAAAVAVAASFIVTVVVTRRATDPDYRTVVVPDAFAAVLRRLLRGLGLLWWYGAIVVGFVVADISPLPAVLLWIGIWVALPITAALVGNPWPSLSPFRTTFGALEWLARRLGIERLDAGLPYPPGLARWPAVALFAAGLWCELILPGTQVATTVATLMAGYTVLTLAGMMLFGPVAWLRNGELFEVLLGWLGRIGPVARRSMSRDLCAECGEMCSHNRCIDCPECAAAADDGERRAELRWWFLGLTESAPPGWSDAAFIVLVLAGVTYDGLRETAFGAALLDALLTPITGALGVTSLAFLLTDTAAFALVVAAFILAFWVTLALTRALATRSAMRPAAYASTLLPIAAGYLIAHYLTLVIQGVVWLPSLLADPLMSLAPDLGWIPVGAIWYLSVGAIVGGHIAGVVLAHRLALRDAPDRATVTGLPMLALMISYTVLSLWIIAQPIVIEPGVAPAALR
jgi:hypothetical protein